MRRTLEDALDPARAAERAGDPAPARVGAGTPAERRTLLVAWSGGPDSAALLGLVELLVRPLALRLVVGHVDHGLRSESSDEAAFVLATARARGHDVRTTRLALAGGPGLPARARAARRAALRAQALDIGAAFVVLGHTATDQAETILLHATRGAGLAGLSAMAPCEPCEPWEPSESSAKPGVRGERTGSRWQGTYLRPLLHLSRAETRELARELAIPFVDDPTNHDVGHPRVAIREQVLPVLRAINPAVESHLGALARVARDAERAIAAAGESLLADATRVDAVDRTRTLELAVLRRAPTAVRAAVVRSFCQRAGVPLDALHERTLAAIDAAVVGDVAEPGRTRRWDLHPRLTLWLDLGHLRLVPAPAADEKRLRPNEESAQPTAAPAEPPEEFDTAPAVDPNRSGPNH